MKTTVTELIEMLKKMPPGAVVGFEVYTGGLSEFMQVGAVMCMRKDTPGCHDGGAFHRSFNALSPTPPKTTEDIVVMTPASDD